jgi:hypothetical protein
LTSAPFSDGSFVEASTKGGIRQRRGKMIWVRVKIKVVIKLTRSRGKVPSQECSLLNKKAV